MEHKIVQKDINSLIFAEYNPRQLTKEQYKHLKDSIQRFGLVDPIIVNSNKERKNIIVGGHQRVRVAKDMDIDQVPVLEIDLTYERERELNVRLNKNTGEWDFDVLANTFDVNDLLDWGFDERELSLDLFEKDDGDESNKSSQKLSDKFIIPPFSVWDSRQGYWRERKRCWLDIGIRSELGREENLLKYSKTILNQGKEDLRSREEQRKDIGDYKGGDLYSVNGTSAFDPVTCEITYKWFCKDKGSVLDPFAGGSVRGIIAEKLGFNYTGIELREEQVVENRKQAEAISVKPNWIVGDSANVSDLVEEKYDCIFSCPPYYDLEVYSELDGELSAYKTYDEFLKNYSHIINESVKLLKDDRFACFVVTNIRDKQGIYRDFVSDTISSFKEAGMEFYNDIIYFEAGGTAALRAARIFKNRKVTKVHQNILVFYKGDVKNIRKNFPSLELDYKIEDFESSYGEELTLKDISGEIV